MHLKTQVNRKYRHMNKEAQAISNDLGQLADDARALMTATADVAGEKVGQARERLGVALDRAKVAYGRVRETTDKAVHEHPYQAIGVAVGVGAVLGYLLACRCSGNRD